MSKITMQGFQVKSDLSKLDFKKDPSGLLPAIVQHARTREVLMLGYMNPESLKATLASGKVTFYSRSKQRLWMKGETSGDELICRQISADCDQDTLLILAAPLGPTCHLGRESCFEGQEPGFGFLMKLAQTIRERKLEGKTGESYTARLFEKGLDRIAQKVGEEAVETVIASKNDDLPVFMSEASDLLYHLLVLIEAKGTSLEAVIETLRSRAK